MTRIASQRPSLGQAQTRISLYGNLHHAAHLTDDVVVLSRDGRVAAVEIVLECSIQHPLPFPCDVIRLCNEKLERPALLDGLCQLLGALILDVVGSAYSKAVSVGGHTGRARRCVVVFLVIVMNIIIIIIDIGIIMNIIAVAIVGEEVVGGWKHRFAQSPHLRLSPCTVMFPSMITFASALAPSSPIEHACRSRFLSVPLKASALESAVAPWSPMAFALMSRLTMLMFEHKALAIALHPSTPIELQLTSSPVRLRAATRQGCA